MTTETRSPAEIAASLNNEQRAALRAYSRGVITASQCAENVLRVGGLAWEHRHGAVHGWPERGLTDLGRLVAAELSRGEG